MTFYNLGLIGYPISASISPKIHGAALKETGLNGEYKLYPIAPDDIQGLKDLLNKVRTGEMQGLNVTIPHKQNVIPLLDELSDTAKTIGAVNTIIFKDGKLIGDNTDAPGFWNDLQKLLKNREDLLNPPSFYAMAPHALILGAGGAARAVCYALLNAGWDITLATRADDIPQAEELIADFNAAHEEIFAINDPSSIVEFVGWTASVACKLTGSGGGRLAADGGAEHSGSRQIYFEGAGIVDTSIHAPAQLTPGEEISGPAIIETPFTTIVIDPGASFHLANAGSINITP